MNSTTIRVAALLTIVLAGATSAATLTGRITRSNGTGVHPCDIDVWTEQGAPVVLTGDTTTVTGNYTLTLPPGRYDVRFQPPFGSHLFSDLRKGVQVSTTTTLDRSLPAASYLSGRVIDAQGNGVAGVNLDFRSPTTGDQAANQQDDNTLADGSFVALVDPGVWDVEFLAPLAAHLVPGRLPAVALTSDASIPDRVLASGHLVTITVTDQGFFPIADADLDVRPSAGGPKLFTPKDNTDGSGFLQLVLPAGQYDFTASPPPGAAYSTRTVRQIDVQADLTVPNLDLPPGVLLSARSVSPSLTPVGGVDCDLDSLPNLARLEVVGDASGENGTYSMLVATHAYRATFTPAVATRLLPVRLPSVTVGTHTNLGDIVHAQGHWVDVLVVDQATGAPVSGANLDFVRMADSVVAINADDVTAADGRTRVVTSAELFRLRVIPPTSSWAPYELSPFRTLSDTSITIALAPSALDAGDVPPSGLRLSAPWPNPWRESLRVAFATPHETEADLSAWDVHGRRVATIFSGRTRGTQVVTWSGRAQSGAPLSPGLYWLRLSVGSETLIRRVTRLD